MSAFPVGAAPLAPEARYETLDVLRGVALFGVFLMNFIGFEQWVMATEAQMLSLPTVGLDAALRWTILWLVGEKANTLFAFLFGLGFSIQMQRLQGRGAPFESIYLRRLAVLLLIGIVHQVFFWSWDILHLYALAGFALFAMRNSSDRTLLSVGIPLALFARPLVDGLAGTLGLHDLPGRDAYFGEAAVLHRQALSAAGDYLGLLENFTNFMWYDYIASGLIAGWFGYALGRFLVGHWVGRRGYLTHPERYLDGYRRVLRIALPTGLVVCGVARVIELHQRSNWAADLPWLHSLAEPIHLLGTPFLACGYLCAIVLGLHSKRARRWLLAFAPVGRMALTNYLAQSLVYAFVLFGVGPGLGLAGRIGTLPLTVITILGFAAQAAFSQWWLARFRFGPVEWFWRALTYGTLPAMRIARPV